jgi:hypothetical protein
LEASNPTQQPFAASPREGTSPGARSVSPLLRPAAMAAVSPPASPILAPAPPRVFRAVEGSSGKAHRILVGPQDVHRDSKGQAYTQFLSIAQLQMAWSWPVRKVR